MSFKTGNFSWSGTRLQDGFRLEHVLPHQPAGLLKALEKALLGMTFHKLSGIKMLNGKACQQSKTLEYEIAWPSVRMA